MSLQVNKAIAIANIAGATVPDGVAKIGNLKLEDDGTLTYSMHYYLTVEDMDSSAEPISFETFNMSIPNLKNQILTNAKTQPSFNQAVDL